MNPIVQTITPNTLLQYILLNQTWINAVSTVLTLLKDRTTFIGFSGTGLQSSVNVDTATTPTWTALHTFPNTVAGFTELGNGEALVTTLAGTVFISSGWSPNKATATWTLVLTTIGGGFTANYCVHDWSNAANGTVLLSESGAQTAGGSANESADVAKARRVWVSKDFGLTWALIFDIYMFGQSQGVAYPGGVHIHGVAYDQEWDRIWVCYGDNTGDGKTIAGAGYVQVVFSDNGGTTWQKLATPPYWDNTGQPAQTLQYIVPIPFNNAVVFTTDATAPFAPVVYPKTGFRQLGEPHVGPMYGSAVNGSVRKITKDARFPTFFAGQQAGTQTGTIIWSIPVTEDDGFTWSAMKVTIPLQSPVTTGMGFTQVLGPTLNGRVVCTSTLMYANNDNTKKTMVADLAQL